MGSLLIGRHVVVCELAYGDNREHRCCWCGNELTGRQARWCSPECDRGYASNHYWTDARHAAVRRDGRCVRCGANADEYVRYYAWAVDSTPYRQIPRVDWNAFLASLDPDYLDDLGRARYPHPTGWGRGLEPMLARCIDAEHRCLAAAWFHRRARAAWWGRAVEDAIAGEILARSLEVNHIEPVLGRHAESGCHHHLAGLEVLCHRHHVAETNRQRAAGLLAR